MSYTISPNMSLVIPTVGSEPGPTYAQDINNSLSLIDQHSHTLGSGVPITPAAININANLPFSNYFITGLGGLTLTPQTTTPSNSSVFVSGVDLHYLDGNGNNIQITSGGTVNATSSGISSGTASASFISGILVVNSNTNAPASIQSGSIIMGNSNVTNSKYLTLQAPFGLSTNFSITLPSIPAQTSFMAIDTAGNMTGYVPVTNGITRTNLAAVGQQISASGSGTNSSGYNAMTNLTVTLTTTGRPVFIMLQPDGSGTASYFLPQGGSPFEFQVALSRDGQSAPFNAEWIFGATSSGYIISPSLCYLDTPPAGSHTYQLWLKSLSTSTLYNGLKLVAYEL